LVCAAQVLCLDVREVIERIGPSKPIAASLDRLTVRAIERATDIVYKPASKAVERALHDLRGRVMKVDALLTVAIARELVNDDQATKIRNGVATMEERIASVLLDIYSARPDLRVPPASEEEEPTGATPATTPANDENAVADAAGDLAKPAAPAAATDPGAPRTQRRGGPKTKAPASRVNAGKIRRRRAQM
jgi:hypothetical protein